MFLRTPAAGSIGFGMTLFFMVGFTMLIEDWGAQLLSVLVLVQSVLILDGLPSMAMSPICPCYLPIAGTVVGRRQGVSTHRWACAPCLWGPLLLRDPLQFSLGPHGTQLPCVATRRHCRSLGGGAALYQQEETYTLGSSFHPPRGGLAGGSS
ncbi:hypothetical protein NQZ68_010830 [Dissostichus eleginoides]|nr:hypothetical protein NQZ68_010830 [Dissostichus eleginoides]